MGGQSASTLVAPIFLRLALGATLLWSGIGLLSSTMLVEGDRAALLANMGSISPKGTASTGTVPPVEKPAAKPDSPKPDAPKQDPAKPQDPAQPPATPKPSGDTGFETPPLMQVTQPAAPAVTYTAKDFSEPVEVARLYRIALLVHDAANPIAKSDGSAARALWPKAAASDRWPVYIAWTVALSLVVGGALIVVGLFTRLGAFVSTLSVGVLFWLAMLVPTITSGTAQWGFIPAGGAWDLNSANEPVHGFFMWTLLQLAACMSLVFLGGGFLSLDRILFPGGEVERSKPKNLPARPTPGD